MRLRKLAEMLVSEYSFDSPGSEAALISIDNEVRRLRESIETDCYGITTVKVEIDDYD